MADRIIKGDSGNDVIIQNNAGSRKIEVTNSGDVEVTGDVKTTTVKASNLKANDGTASLSVADSTGQVTASAKIDLNGNELILDVDADTSITADTDDQIDFRAGGTDSVKIGNEHLTINNGNLVIGTAGHGIDFSINSHQSGMTSELLDVYEEGIFTPTFLSGGSASSTIASANGYYTKIGNLVHISVKISITSAGGSGDITVGGLPFTSSSSSNFFATGVTSTNKIDCAQQLPYVAELLSSSNVCEMRSTRNSQANSYVKMQASNVGSSSILGFSLTYLT